MLQDSGLCGGSENIGCDVLGKVISKPKVSNRRPARHNSLTDDMIIGLKFSRTTFLTGITLWTDC